MRNLLVTVAAMVFIGASFTACSSTGEGEELDPTVAAAPAEAGENGAIAEGEAPVNNEGGVVANGEAAPSENAAAGNELQNLVQDGASNAAGTPSEANAGAPAAAGEDPFAAAANTAAPEPVPADAGVAAADPFQPAPEAPPAEVAPESSIAPVPAEVAAAPAVAESPAPVEVRGGVLPEMGTKMPYYIQRGDTLALIAQKIYGNKNKWKSLAEENNIKDPSLIYAGDVVLYTLSENTKGFAEKYESAPVQTVKVAQGDSLSTIAEKVLGNAGEWRTLWKANPQIKNPDVISAGMVLNYRNVRQVAALENEAAAVVVMNE